ncbi:MAG: hypothetical protein EA428_01490, partial [Spirochaetaceae bacterium]
MKKRFMVLAVLVTLLLVLPLQAFAQEQEDNEEAPAVVIAESGDATITESRIFNVTLGFLGGYHLGEEETVVGRQVSLNFSILENAQIGIEGVSFQDEGGASVQDEYAFVRFDYFFTEFLSLSIGTGSHNSGTAAGTIGANALLIRSVPENGLSSSLKAGV